MAAAVHRKQHLSDNEDTPTVNIDGVTQQPAAQEPANGHSAGAAKAAVAAAAKRLHRQPLFKRINQRISRIRSWLWSLIEELFEVRHAVLPTCCGHSCAINKWPGGAHAWRVPNCCTMPQKQHHTSTFIVSHQAGVDPQPAVRSMCFDDVGVQACRDKGPCACSFKLHTALHPLAVALTPACCRCRHPPACLSVLCPAGVPALAEVDHL
jgi:hypothetical protein